MPSTKRKKDDDIKQKKRECEQRRRDKIKKNPVLHEEAKAKARARYAKRKQDGKIQLVKDMSERDLRAQRKIWAKNKSKLRARRKAEEATTSRIITPPSSDNEGTPPPQTALSSSSKKAGRKKVRRDRAKVYRDKAKLEQKLNAAVRRAEKYKKRLQRLQSKKELTPNTKVKKLLKGRSVPVEVKRKLVFGEVLEEEIVESFKGKNNYEKAKFSRMFLGKSLWKYRKIEQGRKLLFIKKFSREKKTRLKCLDRVVDEVTAFYNRDDVSKLCPGKKDTITRKGQKQQKRYLTDTLTVLHKKFIEENKRNPYTISLSSFCKLRPYWVVAPQISGRDTCMCVKCENIKLTTELLHRKKVLSTNNAKDACMTFTCNVRDRKDCVKRKCTRCADRKLTLSAETPDVDVIHSQWLNKKVEKVIKGQQKETTIVIKEDKIKKLSQVVGVFNTQLDAYLMHTFLISHQYSAITKLKESLTDRSVLIHMDFSENFQNKYSTEVQSMHFGGSRGQVSIHTVVVYRLGGHASYATLSDCLRHDAAAVLAHLGPIFEEIKEIPLEEIHFYSDSPSTQYRNKTIFYLISTLIPQMFPTVNYVTWNYSEAGHGKGACDGVGAVIKRTADRLVAHGNDIPDLSSLLSALKGAELNVKIHQISESQITAVDCKVSSNIKPFVGTMKVRQVVWEKTSNTSFRSSSCFQCKGKPCVSYHLGSLEYEMKRKLQIEDIFTDESSQESRQTSQEIVEGELENMQSFVEHDWVWVLYDSKKYPGEILEISETDGIKVSAMQPVNEDKQIYKWPARPDICWYNLDEIANRTQPPRPLATGSRTGALYTFK